MVSLEDLTNNSMGSISKAHRVDFYQVYYFEEGTAGELEINFEKIQLSPQKILFVPSHVICSFSPGSQYKGKVILFTDFFISQNPICKNNLLFRRFQTPQLLGLGQEKIKALFEAIEVELHAPNTRNSQLILLNYLENIMLFSERMLVEPELNILHKSRDQQLITEFYDLVNTYYKSQKKLEFYCDQLSISYADLHRITHEALGMSPKILLNKRINLEAKSLLAYTDDSIKQISYGLGLNEPSYFTVFFKKHEGLSPKEFREKFEKYK